MSSASVIEGKCFCSLLVGPNQEDTLRLWFCIVGDMSLKLVWKRDHDITQAFLRDGGLLDDIRSLHIFLSYCKEESASLSPIASRNDAIKADTGASELHNLLSEQGAHSSTLGISNRSLVCALCSTDDTGVEYLWHYIASKQESVRHLTERSLEWLR